MARTGAEASFPTVLLPFCSVWRINVVYFHKSEYLLQFLILPLPLGVIHLVFLLKNNEETNDIFQEQRFSKSPYGIQMELRDGFMPLKCWKCELCDICYKFVELTSLPLPLQTFHTEIRIGGCEENCLYLKQLFMVVWVIIWQSKLCFVKKKTAENKYLPSHPLPAQGIYRVYPGVAHQFRAWLLNLRAGRCRKGKSHFLWSAG